MLDFETWIIFLTASIALAFTPGPGMMYVLSRAISGGRAVGVSSSVGAAGGGMLHVFGAAIGISAVIATSALAFTIVKYLGAAFLIFLGLRMLASARSINLMRLSKPRKPMQGEIKSAFYQGVISEFLNPKTAIFFFAFIPQFIQAQDGNVFLQFLVLGIIVVVLNMVPDLLISFFSKPIETLWRTRKRFRIAQQLISGLCLIGLGAYLALSEPPKPINHSL